MTDTAARRYSTGAMIFHWLIAILVIMNWRIAETAEHLEGADKLVVFGYHKAWGMLILALTVGRLLWRWSHPVPPLPSGLKAWEAKLARTVHVIFYVLLVALPLGGWLASSYGGRPVDFFGMFTIPVLPVGENKDLSKSIFDAHATGGSIFIYLIGLHILGALKHTFIDKNGGIFRMLPFGKA
ncbi:cytochrome b [Erythrobacter mangrovi]|uniref:Cytochrome b n=1 Tax=Erythrobacter mangrovi TaxID=2739433 RepID=A0A7D4B9B8_9SPHN|nr:cytochrome b [Erythrobacter mangrovi]QKG69886.1 cytochrome b [Erythrobacter mangrovi]